ncbi:MAG: hypothetical protein Q7T81_06885 [Pseudolabrys sp.]|nr:hypothetical protein [Pseudolabrys sp.]
MQIERAHRMIGGGLDATTKARMEAMLRDLEAAYRKQAEICEP